MIKVQLATRVRALERFLADPVLRLARPDEADAIDELMKASTRDIFPTVDRTLLRDGTYFVFEAGGELVSCGG